MHCQTIIFQYIYIHNNIYTSWKINHYILLGSLLAITLVLQITVQESNNICMHVLVIQYIEKPHSTMMKSLDRTLLLLMSIVVSCQSKSNNTDVIKLTENKGTHCNCLLYTSPSPRDATLSRMPSSA